MFHGVLVNLRLRGAGSSFCSLVVTPFPVSLAAQTQTQTKHQKNSQTDIFHVSQLSMVHPDRNVGPRGPELLIDSVQTLVEQLHGSSHRVCGSGLNDLLRCEPESRT